MPYRESFGKEMRVLIAIIAGAVAVWLIVAHPAKEPACAQESALPWLHCAD